MRTIDTTLKAEFEKDAFAFFFMVKLGFSTPIRCTDWDVPVYYDSEKYTPWDMQIQSTELSAAMSVDRMTVDLDNVDRVISTALLSEDCRNKEIFAYVGANVTSSGNQIVEEFFRGRLDSWDIRGETKVSIEVVNEFIFWNKKTLRIHSSTCPWTFKGTECGYSGAATWCDQSYDRCAALSNRDDSGGFRFLPSIAEKEIWWGRIPA